MSTPDTSDADAHAGRKGRVYLVGAGPGDPGLLTARALELIATADVILYDRLIPAAALDGARREAEVLFVGKEGGGPSIPQEQTEALILDRARAGGTVVRLKGGDPFVFGRGGEEALALRDAGIPFEIVPGVTSGVAAAAYAGIPVTHRGLATAVALVTGHTRADGPKGPGDGDDRPAAESDLDWTALAAFPGTLVFYMGVRQLPQIAASLIAAGRPADEPVAVVERGTLPDQRTVTGTLETIAESARREDVRAPAITVVGAVAGLAGQLEWRDDGAVIRCAAAPWPSPARASRQAASRGAWRSSERGSCRPRRSAPKRLPAPRRISRDTTWSASPAQTRSPRCSRGSPRRQRPAIGPPLRSLVTRARSRARVWRQSDRVPRARWPSTG